MIAAYRQPDRRRGRDLMQKLINDLSHAVPTSLTELTVLGRTLKRRAADVLAYFAGPAPATAPPRPSTAGASHLRGSALGFRNLTNYIARSLLESGGFRPRRHPRL
jgi:transposase